MSPHVYGYSGCHACGSIVSVGELNEITVAPSFADGSEGPAVRAFVCDACDASEPASRDGGEPLTPFDMALSVIIEGPTS